MLASQHALSPACPVCGSRDWAPEGTAPGLDQLTYELCSCVVCGVVRVPQDQVHVRLSDYYGDDYYSQNLAGRRSPKLRLKMFLESSHIPALRRLLQRSSIGWLPQPSYAGARLLDVGCGDGATMLRARAMGWDAEGCEVSESASSLARQHGFRCYSGEWEDLLPHESFDLVWAHHCLEHVPDPARALAAMCAATRERGMIVIGLPNFDSAVARTLGGSWWATKAPHHLWHFSAAHLERMLQRSGFVVTRVRRQSIAQGLLQPAPLASQWRLLRGLGWSPARIATSYARAMGVALRLTVKGTGPVSGQGYAFSLECARPSPTRSPGPREQPR